MHGGPKRQTIRPKKFWAEMSRPHRICIYILHLSVGHSHASDVAEYEQMRQFLVVGVYIPDNCFLYNEYVFIQLPLDKFIPSFTQQVTKTLNSSKDISYHYSDMKTYFYYSNRQLRNMKISFFTLFFLVSVSLLEAAPLLDG